MEITSSDESWYIPHHLVEHNGKHRLVFDCSYKYKGESLNSNLLPGPTLGPSLLGVLLRFREHQIAISGDIRAMFHQVRLLPSDKPLLRFLWRNMNRDLPVEVYEWQVLPFGTTSSPCCAIYALQRHVQSLSNTHPEVQSSVLTSFYVDNCLQSFPTVCEAKEMITKLCSVLLEGGFEIRQWISNNPSVINHLPVEARSPQTELWLSHDCKDPCEGTLGMSWHCMQDTLGYKHRPVKYKSLTLRILYRILARQYDPLGFIIPFTTGAKILLQQLWTKPARGWDDPDIPESIKAKWTAWEKELPNLAKLQIPRWYGSVGVSAETAVRELHIFCDASEQAYGAVAYLRLSDGDRVHVSFVMARSRVAPKKTISVPCLELCAALSGSQLANLLIKELSVPIHQVTLWSDSTTVLTWICSESCRYKVFVANRITEILEHTTPEQWRYVDTGNNPADDITRGERTCRANFD